ncbi:malto-oligosyltrehalose synthase [Desulfuromonas sp. AOP6]|uniref:malto-oligosyltrehalose synthase n=1 Tax=Desulfuromonas sp. AOP6 TaxID=1566351 RepID=UPI001282B882|nr:malto-oligosyltrehalose synthase [Desulfuromonas sp. AOP6]BCA79934.1 maltooligosyl trehalose synthase [Desulfuromonas sp. AOP6]
MRIPRSTYRLQFTPDFGFKQTAEVIAYLGDLGISDLYASPVFRARPGSTSGYDLVDPEALHEELGTPDEFNILSTMLRDHHMGWLQDIVPNHMAYHASNPYLTDILENGPDSPFYHYFDIDWKHHSDRIHGKVLAPFLGSHYGEVLEKGELQLSYGESGFFVAYHSLHFPLRIETYHDLLSEALTPMQREVGKEHPHCTQLAGLLSILKSLRQTHDSGERYHQIRFIKQNIGDIYRNNRSFRKVLDEVLVVWNGEPGKPASFNRLEALLADQWFRLAHWKVASEEINYRRFFGLNDLICLRMEHQGVFEQTHAFILRLAEEGVFSGLRIDHIDGLYDPATYLQQLRSRLPDTFLVVEKILARDESLPAWPIQGTTGYDFLNDLNSLFCGQVSEKGFNDLYREFSGQRQSCEELNYASRKRIIERNLFGDIINLAHLLKRIANRHRHGLDIPQGSLQRALIEILAHFPVYRTYLDGATRCETELQAIEKALSQAKKRNPDHQNEIDYVGRILSGEIESFRPHQERRQWLHFTMRFQQLSGPVMAKGFEDTLLYVYNRLLSLNEVGGDPSRFGLSAAEFHDSCRRRHHSWPHTLNATSTHDTKRGEDIRARLNVLSELPQEWRRLLQRWSRRHRSFKPTVRHHRVPDKNDEYFLYQTLVGAWPFANEEVADFRHRLKKYVTKSVREAKTHTAWIEPDKAYEEAFLQFVERILDLQDNPVFYEEFLPFLQRVAHFGMLNTLSQTLIKITAPGIPDFYQGTEFWDLNLVDPDNRRPVDFARRRAAMQEISRRESIGLPGLLHDLLAHMDNGWIKLFLIRRGLRERHRYPELFQQGDYLPLEITGPGREHVIAFARRQPEVMSVTIAPRLLAGWLEEGSLPLGRELWGNTALVLPGGSPFSWRESFTEAHISGEHGILIGEVLQSFPVGLLIGQTAVP